MFPWIGGDRRVVMTAVFCGTLVMIALIGAVTALSLRGASNVDLMLLVTSTINPIITVMLYGRVATMGAKVDVVAHQVNGERSKDRETIQALAMGTVPAPTQPPGPAGAPDT